MFSVQYKERHEQEHCVDGRRGQARRPSCACEAGFLRKTFSSLSPYLDEQIIEKVQSLIRFFSQGFKQQYIQHTVRSADIETTPVLHTNDGHIIIDKSFARCLDSRDLNDSKTCTDLPSPTGMASLDYLDLASRFVCA